MGATPSKHSIGDGLAYSYYSGFLKIVLPELSNGIDSSEDGKWKDTIVSKKLLILVPESGELPSLLQDVDENISFEGKIQIVQADVAGTPQRPYSNNIYKAKINDKEIIFVADMPANLNTLRDMVADHALTGMTAVERLHEVKRFVDMLKKTINAKEGIVEKCEIVMYDDKQKKISEVIGEKFSS
ncbi:PREDICTED: stimulator of interferon genes protein-like [Priapulus caudatus]|uniref:Stimulator of interferon genes protein-like n=1 Tax=Priapulus caudatus TaxID=37621 RepID=A0ABM1EDH8_PRICU|nr:PREDICTED: stimulator of interferon genes protein-like [Priapulus caudatus]